MRPMLLISLFEVRRAEKVGEGKTLRLTRGNLVECFFNLSIRSILISEIPKANNATKERQLRLI